MLQTLSSSGLCWSSIIQKPSTLQHFDSLNKNPETVQTSFSGFFPSTRPPNPPSTPPTAPSLPPSPSTLSSKWSESPQPSKKTNRFWRVWSKKRPTSSPKPLPAHFRSGKRFSHVPSPPTRRMSSHEDLNDSQNLSHPRNLQAPVRLLFLL